MSDFLTRMAERSRGEAVVVTPLLPSLFDPMGEMIDTAPALTTGENSNQPQRETEAGRSSIENSVTTVVDDARQPKAVVSVESAANHSDMHRTTNERSDKTEVGIAPLFMAPDKSDKVFNTTGPAAAAVPENKKAPAIRKPSENEPYPTFETDESQTRASAEINDKTFEPLKTMGERQGSVISQLSSPLVQGYTSSQTAPQQIMAELPTAMKQDDNQEPTVHINIGRVEVRANTSAPVPAPRPARPKTEKSLSLNEYLKRGGGRS